MTDQSKNPHDDPSIGDDPSTGRPPQAKDDVSGDMGDLVYMNPPIPPQPMTPNQVLAAALVNALPEPVPAPPTKRGKDKEVNHAGNQAQRS